MPLPVFHSIPEATLCTRDALCARHYLAGQVDILPNATVVAFGGKAQHYVKHLRAPLFCDITQNWRGKPLRTFETIVDMIGSTRTAAGLRVKAKLGKRKYPTGEAATKAEMDALSLQRNDFHDDCNYALHPR